MIEAVRASLARHLPSLEIRSIARLGEGMDNVAYEVNGALVVRASKAADPAIRAEVTRREAELLAVIAAWSTLPVPKPVFADVEAGILAYPKLPSHPLMDAPFADPRRLAAPLGAFLSRLHRIPAATVEGLVEPDADPLAAWLEEAQRHYREVAAVLPAAARQTVEAFLGRPAPPEPATAVFCHNDLGSEHILVDPETSAITGVIDWTDAALADPMHDLALIYRDLGPDAFDLTLAAYEGPRDAGDRERSAFYARCALLADLAYGARRGASRYAAASLAHLDRTFA